MPTLKKIDWIKWIILALGAWLIIYPHPYKILVSLLVVTPLITLIIHGVIGRRPSISTLFDGVLNNQSTFSPITHLFCSMILLGFRVFMDYDPESMLVLIGVGLVSILALCLLMLITHKLADRKDDMTLIYYILIGVLLLFYSPTSMFAINCVYDNTEKHVYPVKVVDKHKSSSSSKSGADFHLKVTSWIQNSEPVSIEVSSDKYYEVEKGDVVNVYVGDGLFGVRWYNVGL